MKIILTGYRASGKTTAGKLLGLLLNIPFYDADAVLEEMAGASIKYIIAHHGWEYFREKETQAIQLLSEKGDCVIATGGGVILKEQNIDLLRKMGKIVWLNAPVDDIIDRLEDDAAKEDIRPRFTADDLVQETISVYAERLPLYKKFADLKIDTAGKSAPQIAEIIYHSLVKQKIVDKVS